MLNKVNNCSYTEASLNTQKAYYTLLLKIVESLDYKLEFDDGHFYYYGSNASALHFGSCKLIALREKDMFGNSIEEIFNEDYKLRQLNIIIQHELTHALQAQFNVMILDISSVNNYTEYKNVITKMLAEYSLTPNENSLFAGYEQWINKKHLYSNKSVGKEIPAYYLQTDLESFLTIASSLS